MYILCVLLAVDGNGVEGWSLPQARGLIYIIYIYIYIYIYIRRAARRGRHRRRGLVFASGA